VGLSNIANSFVQGFPGAGSLSRSAVNNSSGVRTPLGGLYTGILVILALLFFTPYFYYIPKSTLAAIIIAAVIFMVEVKVVKPMWRTKSNSNSSQGNNKSLIYFHRKRLDSRRGNLHRLLGVASRVRHPHRHWNQFDVYFVPRSTPQNLRGETNGNYLSSRSTL
jgi:hypothetical protein